MMAPAGHVTVVIVADVVPELHAVEYRPREAETDGLAGREADRLRDLLTDGVTPPARRDALTDGDTAPPIALAERERDGERERDVDGLADALTSLHCT